MRRWSGAAVALGLIVMAALLPTGHAQTHREPRLEALGETEAEGAPEDWVLSQRVRGSGVPRGAPQQAAAQADRVAALTAARDPRLAAAAWTFLGPTNIGGRVLDVVPDPAVANTVYIGTASGGVWKSTDGGSTFTAAWPATNPQPIGALARGSDGALYAGTGETGPGGGSITYGGRGIYKSTDGGVRWRNIGLQDTVTTGRIVVDPTNPQRVFVAASGDLFNPGGGRGVYRSTNGGTTWTRVLAGDTATTGAADIAIDPTNPQRMFAAMWDHVRHPDERIYGGVGSGLYRSVDGGTTWQRLAGGLPGPAADVGRIGVAIAPSDPQRVYAIVINEDGTFRDFYRSTNGGDTWQALFDASLSSSQSTYGWWFGRLWVDPANAQHVFAAGVELEESTNGGTSWIGQFSMHADQHGMAWSPAQSGLVYLGNDGGVYRSTSNGTGGWVHATVEPFTQFYSVDGSEQDATRLIGGAQDNSVLRSWPGDWNVVVGGDGEEALIDPANQNNVYGCSQYGACLYSRNGGTSFSSFGFTNSIRYNWFTPVQFDPTNTQVMYLGGNRLHRSTNGAQTWTTISPDLTGGPGPDPQYVFGTITTVAASRSNRQVLYTGTDDGRVWTTPDLGATWVRLGEPGLPTFWVTRVAVDPSVASTAYATFSGYRGGDNGAYVFRTTDGGTTWTDITGNLPKAPVNDIVVTSTSLFVASDVGVFRSTNGGTTWLKVGAGLPRVPIDDLELVASTNSLLAGTFGRGIWRIQLPT